MLPRSKTNRALIVERYVLGMTCEWFEGQGAALTGHGTILGFQIRLR
jgi:hypothetical protein